MQPSLLPLSPLFDGQTFDQRQDGPRLTQQLAVVREYMLRSGWRTLAEIHASTGVAEASISARLRDLRKEKFGSYTVERRRRTKAQHEYRVSR